MKNAIAVIFLVLLVGGCASKNVKPFASLGVGYQLEGSTDYWLQRERDWQCDKWQQAWIEAGLEFKNGCSLAIVHQSWWFCGGPFNERPEVDMNSLIGKCKVGGFRGFNIFRN